MLLQTRKSLAHFLPPIRSLGDGAREHTLALLHTLRRVVTSRQFLVGSGITLAALIVGYLAFSMLPRSVAFSYSSQTCLTNPVILPGLTSKKSSAGFNASPKPTLSIAGYPLYSHKTCITPTEAPKEHASETIIYGNAILKKNIRVTAGKMPVLMNKTAVEKPVPPQMPLVFALDKSDQVFEYRLTVGASKVGCEVEGRNVSCDLAEAGLSQSAAYTVTLERVFEDESAGTVLQHAITTVEAVQVTGTSIAPHETVFNLPGELTFTLNKEAVSFKNARLEQIDGENRKVLPSTAELKGNTLTVRFNETLARSATFAVVVDEITAADGGYLPGAWALHFKTSGGPKVLGVNIGSNKVQPSNSIVISFDSNVTPAAIGEYIKLEMGGSNVAASISVDGNRVTIRPNAALPRCTPFSIRVLDGLKNEFGISGGSAWTFRSRVICQTIFSIGNSVQGRSILAYRFGTGPSKVIYVGGTHGDEKSSVILLNRWIDALEANPERVPGNRTIIIIPNLNPDGYAASRRTNANNVDLNRNFPANNWKQGVAMPGGSYNANGGGAEPLSEPESRALANYVLSQDPRLVLTYHAAAGVVIPNDSGDSDALAHVYDQKSNVGYEPYSSTGAIFNYDTTGAFEDWLHDKHDIPTLLVELWTKTGNEYAKHQSALWHMAELQN